MADWHLSNQVEAVAAACGLATVELDVRRDDVHLGLHPAGQVVPRIDVRVHQWTDDEVHGDLYLCPLPSAAFVRLRQPDVTVPRYLVVWRPLTEGDRDRPMDIQRLEGRNLGVYAQLTSHPQPADPAQHTAVEVALTAVLTGTVLRNLVLSQ
ncbi:hypothetical protein BCF44_122105 [Kutzneria buriramensis]|uniref:Uncharacterized protein n=2 Tax=Kutzneria buriramensis TaxID=1045776 RepID=A0A3E0GYF4_9PSEU|nr:hypothetical protein BCF44_122105 [Kutzneria buriramensis]